MIITADDGKKALRRPQNHTEKNVDTAQITETDPAEKNQTTEDVARKKFMKIKPNKEHHFLSPNRLAKLYNSLGPRHGDHIELLDLKESLEDSRNEGKEKLLRYLRLFGSFAFFGFIFIDGEIGGKHAASQTLTETLCYRTRSFL
jgi:hypothetical protein